MGAGWGVVQQAGQLTTVTAEQYFNVVIELNPAETAHVQVEAGTMAGLSDLIIAVYATLDLAVLPTAIAGPPWDDSPVVELRLDQVKNQYSFAVSGRRRMRIAARASDAGAISTVDMWYSRDGVDL